jgi:hypothetical protein
MLNTIHHALPSKRAENKSDPKLDAKLAPTTNDSRAVLTPAASPSDDRMQALGKSLLSQKHGETFACQYYAASAAAGALEGDAFLEQYRALKRNARAQGMSDAEFRSFEQCLYRRFYQAATRESLRALQAGQTPKVKAEELAYIASVAAVPERDLQRYTLALERSLFVGRIKALQA